MNYVGGVRVTLDEGAPSPHDYVVDNLGGGVHILEACGCAFEEGQVRAVAFGMPNPGDLPVINGADETDDCADVETDEAEDERDGGES
jgi:hypothetical protein